ncbi:phospholipid-transporting ATPase 2 [Iris pallida]|uniref:Phospholipid-transporting ATPase 2 n=1 Tax=Iris pallida TaxID=29817 RepID=A0AAX6HKH7_IRIPA|nr:phospholipid-transporting ATPase 2 [Iris pallida]
MGQMLGILELEMNYTILLIDASNLAFEEVIVLFGIVLIRSESSYVAEHEDLAFVVDGVALEIVLKRYKEAFTELTILSRTAICCRVTPSQKAAPKKAADGAFDMHMRLST